MVRWSACKVPWICTRLPAHHSTKSRDMAASIGVGWDDGMGIPQPPSPHIVIEILSAILRWVVSDLPLALLEDSGQHSQLC